VTADAGVDVEKEEHSFITCGVASWYNHSANQFGGSSEN
jgi:rare lipoprotein A (peptidoglycan hydrolase)